MPKGQIPHTTPTAREQHTLLVLLIVNHENRPFGWVIRTEWTPASAQKDVRGNRQHALQAVSSLRDKDSAAPCCAGVVESSLNCSRAIRSGWIGWEFVLRIGHRAERDDHVIRGKLWIFRNHPPALGAGRRNEREKATHSRENDDGTVVSLSHMRSRSLLRVG